MAIVAIAIVSVAVNSVSIAYGEESVSWKSDYLVGILNYDNESEIPLQVTTFSKDSLKIEWNAPSISSKQVLSGYDIQRKTIDSEFTTIIQNHDPKMISYIDENLEQGYYAYNVIPIVENQKADTITMHGIDRKSNLFSIYMKGQQLLAENALKQNCIKCFDQEFGDLDDTFKYEFSEITKRQNSEFQEKITFEITKAGEFFSNLFDVKSNH